MAAGANVPLRTFPLLDRLCAQTGMIIALGRDQTQKNILTGLVDAYGNTVCFDVHHALLTFLAKLIDLCDIVNAHLTPEDVARSWGWATTNWTNHKLGCLIEYELVAEQDSISGKIEIDGLPINTQNFLQEEHQVLLENVHFFLWYIVANPGVYLRVTNDLDPTFVQWVRKNRSELLGVPYQEDKPEEPAIVEDTTVGAAAGPSPPRVRSASICKESPMRARRGSTASTRSNPPPEGSPSNPPSRSNSGERMLGLETTGGRTLPHPVVDIDDVDLMFGTTASGSSAQGMWQMGLAPAPAPAPASAPAPAPA